MSNKSRLQFPNQKQYIITIPKSLVHAKSWKKGEILEFILDQSANILIRKLDNPEQPSSSASLQFRNKKQFVITIPKSLVMAKGWQQGDELEFNLNEQANIVLKRI